MMTTCSQKSVKSFHKITFQRYHIYLIVPEVSYLSHRTIKYHDMVAEGFRWHGRPPIHQWLVWRFVFLLFSRNGCDSCQVYRNGGEICTKPLRKKGVKKEKRRQPPQVTPQNVWNLQQSYVLRQTMRVLDVKLIFHKIETQHTPSPCRCLNLVETSSVGRKQLIGYIFSNYSTNRSRREQVLRLLTKLLCAVRDTWKFWNATFSNQWTRFIVRTPTINYYDPIQRQDSWKKGTIREKVAFFWHDTWQFCVHHEWSQVSHSYDHYYTSTVKVQRDKSVRELCCDDHPEFRHPPISGLFNRLLAVGFRPFVNRICMA